MRVLDHVGAKRLYLLGTSIMVHVVVLSNLPVWEAPNESPRTPMEITLRPVERSPTPPPPLPEPEEPTEAVPNPSAKRARLRKTPQRLPHKHTDLPQSPRSDFFPIPPTEEDKKNGPTIEMEIRPPFEKKRVTPVFGQADSNHVPGQPDPTHAGGESLATGGGRIGGGIGFDFWAPPDFNEEMAKARLKVGAANEKAQTEKTTDLGQGVICNTEGFWFICRQEGIDACNSAHNDLCRYAKAAERKELELPVIF